MRTGEDRYGFDLDQVVGLSETADEQQRVRGERLAEVAVADTTKGLELAAVSQIGGHFDDVVQTAVELLENGL